MIIMFTNILQAYFITYYKEKRENICFQKKKKK